MRYSITLKVDKVSNSEDFLDNFLKDKMKEFIGLNLNDSRFKNIQNYIEQEYNSTITYKTINYAIESMRRTTNGYLHSFEINNNVMCEEVSNEKLITIIKLIEFGNLDVKGLNIFQEMFNYINTNLSQLVDEYLYNE